MWLPFLSLEKGSIYEFRVSAKNAVDFGQRAVKTVSTPDGGNKLNTHSHILHQMLSYF